MSSSSDSVLEAPAPAFSSEQAVEIVSRCFGIPGEARPLVSERDQNFYIRSLESDRSTGAHREYVLKIANRAEDLPALDFQQSALAHLEAVAPELSVPRLTPTLDGARWASVEGRDGFSHRVWLPSYLPGRQLGDAPATPRLRHNVGRAVAQLARGLRGFFHPGAGRELLWDMKHTPRLRAHLDALADPAERRLAGSVLDRFDADARHRLPTLRSQVIHSDPNDANIIVSADDPEVVAGIIDFGDMVHGALINDLAIALASMACEVADPIEAACQLVRGYHEITPLEDDELTILFDLWCARLGAELVIAAWRAPHHPENVDYISGGSANSLGMLERLSQIDAHDASTAFRNACERHALASSPPTRTVSAESNE